MIRRRAFVLGVVAIYFGIVGFAPVLDHLVLFPSRAPISAGSAVRRAIPFQGGELEVWTTQSKAARAGKPKTYILRFYGNADRAERWAASEAESFNGRSIELWAVNYPGFGGSTGPSRLKRIAPAALAAFDELKRAAGDRPIMVFGTSFGTTTALYLAAHRPVAGILLHDPPPLRQMILRQFGWWNLWLLAGPLSLKIPTQLDSIRNASASHAPAIFLLSENDEVVAPRFQSLITAAYAGPKREILLRGASHNSPVEGEALTSLRTAIDWLMPAD